MSAAGYKSAAEAALRFRPAPDAPIERVSRVYEVYSGTHSGGAVWRRVTISLPRVKFLERPFEAAVAGGEHV